MMEIYLKAYSNSFLFTSIVELIKRHWATATGEGSRGGGSGDHALPPTPHTYTHTHTHTNTLFCKVKERRRSIVGTFTEKDLH